MPEIPFGIIPDKRDRYRRRRPRNCFRPIGMDQATWDEERDKARAAMAQFDDMGATAQDATRRFGVPADPRSPHEILREYEAVMGKPKDAEGITRKPHTRR